MALSHAHEQAPVPISAMPEIVLSMDPFAPVSDYQYPSPGLASTQF